MTTIHFSWSTTQAKCNNNEIYVKLVSMQDQSILLTRGVRRHSFKFNGQYLYEVSRERTLPASTKLVSITMARQSYCQTILHRSFIVHGFGACVAMYSLAEFDPCAIRQKINEN